MSDIFQESPEQKVAWLVEAEKRMPIGTRVRVVDSDVPWYIGATGTVVDYDIGGTGSWSLVVVKFDRLTAGATRDGFYCDGAADDEIARV